MTEKTSSHPANSTNAPPEPEPLTYEEERAQRRRRWLVYGTPLLLAFLVGGWFSIRPALHAVKAWQARRLADRSLALADAGNLREAVDQASDAYQIYKAEPEVWRALGRLLTRAGQGRLAIGWWQRVAQAGKLTVTDRRDWVAAALAADAPAQAETQLNWLLAQPGGGTPADLLLAVRDAAWRQDPHGVESYDRRVLAAPTASARERFAAAIQILYLAAPQADSVALASAQITQLARASTDPLALDALTLLAARATQEPSPASPRLPATGMTPGEIAALLDAHPQAVSKHHLLALEVRASTDPSRTGEWIAEGLQRFGGSDDNQVLAGLAAWLSRLGQNDAVLQLLTPTRAVRNPELARAYLDALAAVGRWSEARNVLEDKHLPLDPVSIRMYLAVVRGHLGESEGAAREWDRALDAAGKDADKLLALGNLAARNGAASVADAAYTAAIAAAPATRPPYVARYQLALTHGQTALAKDVVGEIIRRWPDDRAARAEEIYLRLLLDPTGATAETIKNEVAGRLAQEPTNWQLKTNAALACVRAGRPGAALAALADDRAGTEDLQRELVAAPVRAQVVGMAVLAANGEGGEARAEASRLNSLPMLPEEHALIAPLVAPGSTP